MHLACQTPLFFASASVVESYRCECRNLHHGRDRRKTLRRYVANRYYHEQNQLVAPGVGNSCATVAEPLTPGVAGDKLLPGGTACTTRSCHMSGRGGAFGLAGERSSPVRRPAPPPVLMEMCLRERSYWLLSAAARAFSKNIPATGPGRRVRSKQACRPIGVPPSSSGRTRR
jgi:hypothetical protein